MTKLLKGLAKQRAEQQLFQFLNGLDENYSPQRSHSLLISPLPTVESACSMLHQEELQRQILTTHKNDFEPTTLYSKNEENCSKCGLKGHPKERCWQVIGYPHWHPKAKQFPQKKSFPANQRVQGQGQVNAPHNQGRSGMQSGMQSEMQYNQQRGSRNKGKEIMTAHVDANSSNNFNKSDSMVAFTQQQFEQLLRMMPQSSNASSQNSEPVEDFDNGFAGLSYQDY